MTAFAQYKIESFWGIVIWELSSVNQRYLDINITLPEKFSIINHTIYKNIKSNFFRGKIQCNLYLNINFNIENNFKINTSLVKKLLLVIQSIKLTDTSIS